MNSKKMRLIDAEKLLDEGIRARDGINDNGLLYIPLADVRKSIKNAPAIDAVPVVRCGECLWWDNAENSFQGRCALSGSYPTRNWYCANGQRKEGDDNGQETR